MRLSRFVTYTAIGAFAWCAVLTGIGYFLGRNEDVLRNEEVQRYVTRVLYVLLPLIVVGIGTYVVLHRRRRTAEVVKSA